jgi:hypothetical protein
MVPALESAAAVGAAGVSEPVVVETELPPLTDTEYAQVRLSLSAEGPVPEGLADIPWIADHALTEYIRLLEEIREEQQV